MKVITQNDTTKPVSVTSNKENDTELAERLRIAANKYAYLKFTETKRDTYKPTIEEECKIQVRSTGILLGFIDELCKKDPSNLSYINDMITKMERAYISKAVFKTGDNK